VFPTTTVLLVNLRYTRAALGLDEVATPTAHEDGGQPTPQRQSLAYVSPQGVATESLSLAI